MGNGAFVYGYLNEVFLGSFNALGDSCCNLVSFTEAPAYDTVLVTYDNDSGEGECATTLGYLSNAVDGYQTVFELDIVGRLYSVISFCNDG